MQKVCINLKSIRWNWQWGKCIDYQKSNIQYTTYNIIQSIIICFIYLQLEKLGILINKRRHKYVITSLLILSNILTLVFFAVQYLSALNGEFYKISWSSCLWSFLMAQYYILLNSQFIIWIIFVKIRYAAINSFLMSNFQTFYGNCRETLQIVNTKDKLKLIDIVAVIHDQLVDLTNQLNFCYGLPVSWSEQSEFINS